MGQRVKYKYGRIFGAMFKVLGVDILVNGETNGYFGDPVTERRTE